MAKYVVSFVVQRLGDLLIQEAVFLYEVSDQVLRMQTEMQRMKCFLKDADAKEITDDLVHNWVAEIRDTAYDAEDVVDTFILKVASRRGGGFERVFRRYVFIFNEWTDLYKVGMKMKAIEAKILSITNSLQTYGIRIIDEGEGSSSTNENQRELRRSYPHIEEEDVIGLEKDTEALVEELKKEEVRCRVVSIVGMGGLGKTTLAKKVYSHDVIRRHFDCTAWAFISQQFQPREIIQGILKSFFKSNKEEIEKIKGMKEEELVEMLFKFLEDKRYLVVLDDIWSSDAWDRLKSVFPNGKTGSKVMLTTRNKEVAVHADHHSVPHELRFLKEEESWELLCNKAFPNTGCPPGFEKFKREIVEKCGGLPLVVVVVGGLLAMKKALNEWEMVLSNINTHLNKGKQDQVLGILALSYNDLPYHLKPCFLYLGMFPEDFSIPVGRLIRLWIAEGFISQPQQGARGETMEEVAGQYLAELIHRCMVQVGERSSRRTYKRCRIHDLMRELCLLKAREENFLEIFNLGNMVMDDSSSILATAKSRRHAIHFAEVTQKTFVFQRGALNLRSLLVFGTKEFFTNPSKIELKKMCKDFKLLKVLEIEDIKVEGGFATEIGNLIHLRYLSIGHYNNLPPSIGKLRNLQTLDLRNFNVVVPDVIWKMEQLRYLYLPKRFPTGPLRIDTLSNLQTLKEVQAGSWIEKGHLAKLTNIGKLSIKDISSSEQAEAVLESPAVKLDCLFSLELNLGNEILVFPSLKPLSGCHRMSKLSLEGRIGKHYDFIPPNLSKLILRGSKLEQDPMAMLEKMPNIRFLWLDSYSYRGKEMICSAQGFPQLENLQLWWLDGLEEWRVDGGAMPRLRHLSIANCKNLRMVPEGLRFINTLRELVINYMPGAFEDRFREGGADYYKVKHIPSITTSTTLPEEEM